MENNENLAIALNILERKIANLNIQILKESTPELEYQLDKYLYIKKEIYNGNKEIIDNFISSEE